VPRDDTQADINEGHDATDASTRLGMRTLLFVLAFYLACLAVATYPAFTALGSRLPSLSDPLTHLWTMRWYKACLLEGKSPLRCPDVQYPVGAPLGYFPPMHLQSLMYIPLSTITKNDILCYNLIWIFGFLYTGMGTFALGWHVIRDRAAACFAGLLAMLGTPMLMHAHGHLELMHVGGIPLFLVAWMRFVDQPRTGRLLGAAALYGLVAMSAHYYVVLTIFPAVLYIVVRGLSAGRAGAGLRFWIRERLGWLLAFGALTVLGLLILFSLQLATIVQGEPMARPQSQFLYFRAPLWSYVVPTSFQALSRVLPVHPFEGTVYNDFLVECGSYLGIATLVLLIYAAVNRVRTPCASFLWLALAAMIVLSLGAVSQVGGVKVWLPAVWFWKWFPPFRLIRVPARFNIYACLFASILAAGGLKHLLSRCTSRAARSGVFATFCALAVADLAMIPFSQVAMPPMSGAYRWIFTRNPEATLLEVPLMASSTGFALPSVCGYWQSIHRGRTSGGYSAFPNMRYDSLVVHDSPLDVFQMERSDYLENPERTRFGLLDDARFLDYVWLDLTVNDFDFLVLHNPEPFFSGKDLHLDRLKPLLRHAHVFSDAEATVYDRAKLEPPSRPTLVRMDGWRSAGWPGELRFVAERDAHLAVYNPNSGQPLILVVDASAFLRPRSVRLIEGDREFARWRIEPGETQPYASPPFRLPSGLHRLTLASDGDERPSKSRDASSEGDLRPYSLRVTHLSLRSAVDSEAPRKTVAAGIRARE
jgi:hypothetical protein